MSKALFKKIQIVLWFVAGVALMYYSFKDQDIAQIWATIKKVELKWLAIVLFVSLLTHVFRAIRWQQMLKAVGQPVGFISAFSTMMFGYLVNNAIPRGGEFSRCLSLKKTDDIPFSMSFGTVLVERLIDTLCLALLIAATLFTQYDELGGFWLEHIWLPIKNSFGKGGKVSEYKYFIIGGIAIVMVLMKVFEKKIEESGINQKLENVQNDMFEGLKALLKMKDMPMFVVYTILIWVGYYFMTQLWFYTLPEFANLGWKAALMIMVVGTIGRSVPVQGGGMGAYHFLVAQALLIYGLSQEQGSVMAVLIHETQIIYVLVVGGLAAIKVSFSKFNEITATTEQDAVKE
ncbi:MAG: hypothetical protein RLZZ175_2326 [Bacteroidota bacterium]